MKLQTSLITENHIHQFNEQGYCIIADLYSNHEIQEIEDFFEEYKNVNHRVFGEGQVQAFDEIDPAQRQVRYMQPHRHSKKAQDWMLHPNVMDVLATLLGREALGVQTMYYYKPPGARGQGMHQDNIYLLSAPNTCIAAWTPIDSADQNNGCLYLVPGSHRLKIICPQTGDSEFWNDNKDSHIRPFPREFKPIPVSVPRGSTLFFDGNMIHGSGPNRTRNKWRRTFTGHYIDEISEQVARFYHPVLNRKGEVVGDIHIPEGGGPCGDDWQGGVH